MGSNPAATAVYQQKRRIVSVERPAFCCQGLSCLCWHALGHNVVPVTRVVMLLHHALRLVCGLVAVEYELELPAAVGTGFTNPKNLLE